MHVVNWTLQISKRAIRVWGIWKALVALLGRRAVWLPDALRRVDDGLHDVVSDELPVLLRDVLDRGLCACILSITPVLSYHVLKINHTWTENIIFKPLQHCKCF